MRKLVAILALTSLYLPLLAYAADPTPPPTTPSGAALQFQRQGIFDCNQNGSYAMSVGAMSALGGAYVPVADAAVELNTGTLVYKECVLREVVDREREAALAAFLKQMQSNIQTGRNGNAMYVREAPSVEAVKNAADPAVLAALQGNTFDKSPFKDTLKRTGAQIYEAERNSPENILNCPMKGDVDAFETGQSGTFNFQDLASAGDSACYALGAVGLAENLISSRIAQAQGDLYTQWQWGNGFYPRSNDATDPNQKITLTPSFVVSQSFNQILQSPVQQLQNANDIGQMIGALYAGVTTQVVGDSQGLAGLSQSVGGQPSYLDQVAKESTQGLQNAAVNAALQILGAAQQVESSYYQAVSGIGGSLAQTQQQLQAAERQCWVSLTQNVCATTPDKNGVCTAQAGQCTTNPDGSQSCPTGSQQLKVATSTAFSSAVINSQITPLLTVAKTNIQTSQSALQLVSNLIQGVTNTGSLDAQRVALQQLDTLVASHKLHTQGDLAAVTQQQSAVTSSMGDLLQRVAQTWGGSGTDGSGNIQWDGTINPGNGWCNVNNSGTLASWMQVWKK